MCARRRTFVSYWPRFKMKAAGEVVEVNWEEVKAVQERKREAARVVTRG